MTASLVEKIADAVLYEGYILYPYRPSAVKNRQRWNFGALCPESYSVAQKGTESWTMQTECLVRNINETVLNLKVRFLHLVSREVGKRIADCRMPVVDCGHLEIEGSASHFEMVSSFEVSGRMYQTWQEAIERDVMLPEMIIGNRAESNEQRFSFPYNESRELLVDDVSGETVGVILRRQQAIEGVIDVKTSEMIGDLAVSNESPSKITVKILNRTPYEDAADRSRDDALMRSFVSTHTILRVEKGEFISLLDPPEPFRDCASECHNVGTYPVLVGEEGIRDCMLSSPIILYDYPQIAPESAGNLYDGTEIDEILTLRIMTLTEEEKREMRGADDRARQILERTETLPIEQLMKMHGAMKGVKS
jgi:hypothetical protein